MIDLDVDDVRLMLFGWLGGVVDAARTAWVGSTI